MMKKKELPFILNGAKTMCDLCSNEKCENRNRNVVRCKHFLKKEDSRTTEERIKQRAEDFIITRQNHIKYFSGEAVKILLKNFAEEIVAEATKELTEENNRLEGQISLLLSCKNCPENKGGYICEKEYNDKCLSQKIQYIKELKEELARMTSVADNQQSCNMKRHFKLEQAKEIIKRQSKIIEDVCDVSMLGSYAKETIKQAEQFLKEGEKNG